MINVEKNNQPLDLSYLKEMCGDSPEFIIEMIDLFKSQTPVYISELKAALSAKDWKVVAATAHKVKPTFVYVGREDAKAFMQNIEDNARQQRDLDMLEKDCEEVAQFVEILYKQLDEVRLDLSSKL